MVAKRTLASQLRTIGFRRSIFGRKELTELQKLLLAGESVLQCTRGNYAGGSGLLVVTDQRIILIDKKPFYLNLEEIKYDAITSVSAEVKFLQATLKVTTGSQKLFFRSVNDARIKHASRLIESLSTEASVISKQAESVVKNLYFEPRWRARQSAMLPRRGRLTKFSGIARQA